MSVEYDVSPTLRAQDHGHPPCVLLFEPRSQDGVPRIHGDICPTLNTAQGGATTTMCFNQLKYGEYEQSEQSVTLRANGGDCGGGSEVLVVQNINVECILNLDTTIKVGDGGVCFTLGGTRNIPVVVADGEPICIEFAQANAGIMRGGCPTLNASHENPILIGEKRMNSVVRRLTPLECTRLQGFPDGWVDIEDWTDSKGKKHKDADSPKYKALGNSIALPFWEYLMKRISAQYERRATLGSLFDGISGFPLAWARCNGPESCRWSSEIEEFPMAVCKKHFGDEEAGIEGDVRSYL